MPADSASHSDVIATRVPCSGGWGSADEQPASWSRLLGDITIPSHSYASDLGSGCAHPDNVRVRSFDLTGGQATARMREAADTVLGTALPSAFGQWGHVFDVVVLLYPRTLGMFDPSKAEYIVLLNAGWLE